MQAMARAVKLIQELTLVVTSYPSKDCQVYNKRI